MGFTIVHGSPMTIWAPIVAGDEIFTGSIVTCQYDEGVAPLNVAAGAADTTTAPHSMPFGVVVGNNLYNQTFDTTQNATSITDATPLASTTEFRNVEGVWAKGDKQAMVQIALITPETILRGPLYNAAVGTAPTLLTATTAVAAGTSAVTNATDVAGVDNLATVYFRSGANAGAYRITSDTDDGTTALTWDKPTTSPVAIGDTCVRVPIRALGPTYAQLDAEATYINVAATPATDYYILDIVKLDLSVAGKEHAYFKFGADHFTTART